MKRYTAKKEPVDCVQKHFHVNHRYCRTYVIIRLIENLYAIIVKKDLLRQQIYEIMNVFIKMNDHLHAMNVVKHLHRLAI